MSEQRLRRKGSSRHSSRKRRRRRSSISVSSNGGIDEEEEAILRIIQNDNDDDFEINMNEESDGSKKNDEEDLDSEEEERRERRRRAERRINEEILAEKINQCKELMDGVKKHTWKMSKKLDVVRKAKAYVEKFEGKLSRSQGYQQRGKQLLKQLSRSWKNGMARLVPWEMKIKQIEGHFGSVVASYFVFLRWLLWISVWLTIMPTCFVMLPELIAGEGYGSSIRKTIPDDEIQKAYDLQTIWNAEGIVKYSLVFYGYYGNARTIGNGYRLPLAYLLTSLAAFAYSFIAVLKTMANNSRNSRMSNTDDEYTFSWKLFTEWDYMITNHDTAITKHASITTVFKETILEIKVKSRAEQKWKILTIRILSNIAIALLLALSTYVIQLCVERSRQSEIKQRNDPSYVPGVWEENELTAVMTLISMAFPSFLDVVALIEKFHPRTSLQLMLGRIFILNLLNLYTLFIALYNKQQDLMASISSLESNITYHSNCSSIFPNTTYLPIATTQLMPDVTILPTVNVTEVKCVNVTDIPLKVKEFCWETMIGQEVFKLTVLDMVALILQHLVMDVLRTYFVKYCNNLCCWDIEKNIPGYPEFKTAENLLHLISNQGVVWLGVLFCPGLALLNLIKLYILVYFRCWTVLCYNVPEERIFRASRSNNFYYALLLIMLFLCMLPPLFAIVVIEPSPQCGPFSGQERMYHVITETMETELPSSVNSVIQYAASPGVILPIFMLLGMTIYYLLSVGHSLRDANNELRMQLEYERTEGRRKVYAMADARHEVKSRAKGKGWNAAKSSFVSKSKGMASTAMSILQAVNSAKDGLTKGKIHPRIDVSKLIEIEHTPTAKKSGHALMGKLRAARISPAVPVAVIRGEQSIKANTAATRERNKIAANSAFRSAILEYARKQAQENDAEENGGRNLEASRATRTAVHKGKPSIAQQLKNLQNQRSTLSSNNKRPTSKYQAEDIHVSEDEDEETEPIQILTTPMSRNRLWGNMKKRQPQREVIDNGRQQILTRHVPLKHNSSTAFDNNDDDYVDRGKVRPTSSKPIKPDRPDSAGHPSSSAAVSKVAERRRRLSISSYIDESGYLSPFSEESEEEDDEYEDMDEMDNGQEDENSTEMEMLEDINDDHTEMKAIDDNDNSGNNPSTTTEIAPAPVLQRKHGLRLPFSKLASLKESTPAQPPTSQKPPKSETRTKAVVNIVQKEVGNARKTKKQPKTKPTFSRNLSTGSITGPVPEITVQDFSEPLAQATQDVVVHQSETHDSTLTYQNDEGSSANQKQEKRISATNENASKDEEKNVTNNRKSNPIVAVDKRKNNFDIKKSLFSADDTTRSNKDDLIGESRKEARGKKMFGLVHKIDKIEKQKHPARDVDDIEIHSTHTLAQGDVDKVDENDEEAEKTNTDNLASDDEIDKGDANDKDRENSENVDKRIIQEKQDGGGMEQWDEEKVTYSADYTKKIASAALPDSHKFKQTAYSGKNSNQTQTDPHPPKSDKVNFPKDPSTKSAVINPSTGENSKIHSPTAVITEKAQNAIQNKESSKSRLLSKRKIKSKVENHSDSNKSTTSIGMIEPPNQYIKIKNTVNHTTDQNKLPSQLLILKDTDKSREIFEQELESVNVLPRLKKISREQRPRKKAAKRPILSREDDSTNDSDFSASLHMNKGKNTSHHSKDNKSLQNSQALVEKSSKDQKTFPKTVRNNSIPSSQDDETVQAENLNSTNDDNDRKKLDKSGGGKVNDESDTGSLRQESDDNEDNNIEEESNDSDIESIHNDFDDNDDIVDIEYENGFDDDGVSVEDENNESDYDIDDIDQNLLERLRLKKIDKKSFTVTSFNKTKNNNGNKHKIAAMAAKHPSKDMTTNESARKENFSAADMTVTDDIIISQDDSVSKIMNRESSSISEATSEDECEDTLDLDETDHEISDDNTNSESRTSVSDHNDTASVKKIEINYDFDESLKESGTQKTQDAKIPTSKIFPKVKKKYQKFDSDSNHSAQVDSIQSNVNETFSLTEPRAINNNTNVPYENSKPDTVLDLEHLENHEENLDIESDPCSQAFNDFYTLDSEYGRFRRDRPSLVPASSDDDEMSQSYRDYLKFLRTHDRVPRQINEFPDFGDKGHVVTVPVDAPQSRPFTILAITNGKLDIDVKDIVIDVDEEHENKQETQEPVPFGFKSLLKKFQH